MTMSLTKDDLKAIKKLIDDSIDDRVPRIIDERVPGLVQPMLDNLEKRLTSKHYELKGELEDFRRQVGKFSLETTNNFIKLHNKIDKRNRPLLKT
jgi:hypothetical protein